MHICITQPQWVKLWTINGPYNAVQINTPRLYQPHLGSKIWTHTHIFTHTLKSMSTCHNSDITWVSRHIKSPATLLFIQQLVHAYNKKNHHSLTLLALAERNTPVTGGFPSQRANNAGNLLLRCHHDTANPLELSLLHWLWLTHCGWLTHTASDILVSTGSGNGLLPDSTKSLHEPMLT